MRRAVIIGNGPVEADLGKRIDAADIVIRFNEPPYEPLRTGTKSDILFVVNSGKSMQGRLENPAYLSSPHVANASEIILPYEPSVIARYHPKPNVLSRIKGRKADWTGEAVAMFEQAGKAVAVLPAAFYEKCCETLGIAVGQRRSIFPSTGFVAIVHALERYPAVEWRVEICGFGWHGWKRHDWQAERIWVDRQMAASSIRFIERA